MTHGELIKNGVLVIKPDARLQRAIRDAEHFLMQLSVNNVHGGIRTLVRHEEMLHWLHRELQAFIGKGMRKDPIFILRNLKATMPKDIKFAMRDPSAFTPLEGLENKIRDAFQKIAIAKIHHETQSKKKKRVQSGAEPWQHRANQAKGR